MYHSSKVQRLAERTCVLRKFLVREIGEIPKLADRTEELSRPLKE
jgi:hypothetical protein